LWSLFSFVDKLLGESSYLATGLGLDEQIYRHLALSLFQEEQAVEKLDKYWQVTRVQWANPLDDLVDYIRANSHLNLSLTDLEEHSHYSGRHLQNLFQEKFACTPVQFVRRNRLSVAMARLQTADDQDAVTNIARDFGYAYTSNISADFHREFGVTPSAVLRSSRGPRK
jgi:AraC-like DNA-binding protein